MEEIPHASGPVFYDDHLINLYFLNELYGRIAEHVAAKMREEFRAEFDITAGIWGGTYLIAADDGKAKRRIWRLYSIVNLPQNGPLEEHENLEKFIEVYYKTFAGAFRTYHLDLDLKMWGGRLPYSNQAKPSITLHMEDATDRVRWARTFFTWNLVGWEQSIIYDLVRIIKEYKVYFDLDQEPALKDPKEIKYILQDIIIIYKSLRAACSEEFRNHADPIINELMEYFMLGLHDSRHIYDLYHNVFENALLYGYEEALESPYSRDGLNIREIECWPVEKINWVPEELRRKLIPPIQALFTGFKTHLNLP